MWPGPGPAAGLGHLKGVRPGFYSPQQTSPRFCTILHIASRSARAQGPDRPGNTQPAPPLPKHSCVLAPAHLHGLAPPVSEHPRLPPQQSVRRPGAAGRRGQAGATPPARRPASGMRRASLLCQASQSGRAGPLHGPAAAGAPLHCAAAARPPVSGAVANLQRPRVDLTSGQLQLPATVPAVVWASCPSPGMAPRGAAAGNRNPCARCPCLRRRSVASGTRSNRPLPLLPCPARLQVEGCTADLGSLRPYFQRQHICGAAC